MMRDLWKSNSYLWVEGACQLTWKIWFVGLRAAKNVGWRRLVITPWSMQRSAWWATSTWLGHPQWPLDNGHTLGQPQLWSYETDMCRERWQREKKEISQKCGRRNGRSTSVQPINCFNSFQLYRRKKTLGKEYHSKWWRLSILILLNAFPNFNHYFVGLALHNPSKSFFREKNI